MIKNATRFFHQGASLITDSKYGGGGGHPRRGPNGELILRKSHHFSQDPSGGRLTPKFKINHH